MYIILTYLGANSALHLDIFKLILCSRVQIKRLYFKSSRLLVQDCKTTENY